MHSSSALGPDMINKKEMMTSIVALRNSANEISNPILRARSNYETRLIDAHFSR